ncbi:hypothetical protein P691DRAFT_810743 [Macrolepiota fuliginosa MF-IS2]|uniref:Uncharacterized protein n=1 Tax=Macrolepiota fuliginosa MF-IS2 TaxID=1400762 RepID=A0A9P5X2W9_9AGAR|nr:hypothetical protein P691DRAFT_810743 [Macrolepiota fuliginosa MF-IS2]
MATICNVPDRANSRRSRHAWISSLITTPLSHQYSITPLAPLPYTTPMRPGKTQEDACIRSIKHSLLSPPAPPTRRIAPIATALNISMLSVQVASVEISCAQNLHSLDRPRLIFFPRLPIQTQLSQTPASAAPLYPHPSLSKDNSRQEICCAVNQRRTSE